MSEPPIYYFREGGIVTQSATVDCPDDERWFAADNAFAKLWRGEELTETDESAMAAVIGQRPRRLSTGPALMGYLAREMPDLLAQVDAVASTMANRLGTPEVVTWFALRDYAEAALAVSVDELRGPVLEEPSDDGAPAADGWADCSEGKAAAEAMNTPDDGPDGWSTEPPRDPRHPLANHKGV